MKVVALSVKDAEAFLKDHGRHYKAPVEAICAIGVGEFSEARIPTGADGSIDVTRMESGGFTLHGAAILGRRHNGEAELAHIYVDGTSQGYSLLYGAVWRALKALGYDKTWL